MYPREQYLKKIISKKDNGRIKIITGLRRSGKSVLLFRLYREWLLGEGVKEDQIIALALDILENAKYRNPLELDKYVRDHMVDPKKRYYIFIDEIQFVSEIRNPYVDNEDAKITFIDVILGFMHMDNADVYVTGSNSKMLSSDILTQFRDRGDEICVYPLSFAEFYNEYEGDKRAQKRLKNTLDILRNHFSLKKLFAMMLRVGNTSEPLQNTITPIWGFAMQGLDSDSWKRLISWKTYCTTISSEEA